MVGDLGNTGYRAATKNLTKGFQRVSYPTIANGNLDVDISEMKMVDTAKGDVTASGNGIPVNAAPLASAGAEATFSWDNKRDMVVRIFEFKNPIEMIDELNRPANDRLRAYLYSRGNEARIITRVVRAYNHLDIKKQGVKTELDAKLTSTDANVKIGYSNDSTTERAVKDGTIVAYQWARIIWEKDGSKRVKDLNLDTPLLD